MSDVVLRVRDLSVSTGAATLVRGVSLDLARGRVTTLVGPSGAGKSTIAAAVADVLASGLETDGRVEVADGTRVAHLPQDGGRTLNPARRVGAALGELAVLHGSPPRGRRARRAWRAEQVESLLDRAAFPIDDRHRRLWPRRFPFEFSGGQRTRLALAQVLAVAPDVLVLDEPSTGLDSVSRRLLVDSLARARDEGVAILLVTHDPAVASELGDEVHGVRDGRLVDVTAVATRPVPAARSAPRPEPFLRVTDLTVRLGDTTALHDVDVTVGQGEVVGLVGVSGSGKSTLARAVAGLVPVTSGRLLLDAEPLTRLARRSRGTLADVQYVCQEVRDSFEPDRPVLDQVARTAVRLRGLTPARARRRATELLERLDLVGDAVERRPDGLSGGQLRRAALARSLVARPRLVVCDETTTGLEAALVDRVIDVLDEERRDHGTAVVLVGHDLRALVPRVERLLVLDRGELTDDLLASDLSDASAVLRRLLAADGLTA